MFALSYQMQKNRETLHSQLISATVMHDVLYNMGKDLPWSLLIEQSDFAVLISEEPQCSVVCQFSCIIWVAIKINVNLT